jgi:hypothetical protein
MDAESRYATARDLDDQLTIAIARGTDTPDLARRAATAKLQAREAVTAEPVQDPQAYARLRAWLDEPDEDHAAGEFETLSSKIQEVYAQRQAAVVTNRGTITRLGVLEALSTEPDPDERRALFLALEPVWSAIDEHYAELIDLSRARWAAGRSPVEVNAKALGMDPAAVEPALVAILEAWRPEHRVQPWDWWHGAGAASRELNDRVPLDRLRAVNDDYIRSLGADPDSIGYDIFPRAGRPSVPVAYTEFGGRAEAPRPWVMATYTAGGLGELSELIHESGHAVHVAAIDTRPAYRDWPDSDAFTEALAELIGLDTAEPAWQRHWLGAAVPEGESIRSRYADVMLDICWALLEIRVHRPDAPPASLIWADLTSTDLGIEPHPEWPWWAMRGQLFQEPGYMVNYALAAIIAADLRAAIRAERGDWSTGDPGWYAWVSERLFRFGASKSSGDVLREVLGRGPSADALIRELSRSTS